MKLYNTVDSVVPDKPINPFPFVRVQCFKGIVHFEINFWYVLAYLKGIQDVGVFVSTAFSILTFFGQTVVVCQSYTGG